MAKRNGRNGDNGHNGQDSMELVMDKSIVVTKNNERKKEKVELKENEIETPTTLKKCIVT